MPTKEEQAAIDRLNAKKEARRKAKERREEPTQIPAKSVVQAPAPPTEYYPPKSR